MYELLEDIDRLYAELGEKIASLKIYLTVNPESGLRSIGRADVSLVPVEFDKNKPWCYLPHQHSEECFK